MTRPELIDGLLAVVAEAVERYSEDLLRVAARAENVELANPVHAGQFLSRIDVELHAFYHDKLDSLLGSYVYASEEAEPTIRTGGGSGSDHLVLVDPLDSSELAVRGLHGFTHILIYDTRLRTPIACVVGDFFHHVRFFYAYRDGVGEHRAFLRTRSGHDEVLRPSAETRLSRSLITNYSMRPSARLQGLCGKHRLLTALSEPDEQGRSRGLIGVDFGSVGLCHVAAGFTDGMVEFAKGFALWDLLPGQYILQAAGGTVADLDGRELRLEFDLHGLGEVRELMKRRWCFVAAGNRGLGDALSGALKD